MYDVIGLIGVSIVLASYMLLQTDHLRSDHLVYSVLNLLGSLLLLMSLVFGDWNLPSVIIELFWSLISLFGIYKRMYPRPVPQKILVQ